ncbi:MAG: hypothetical protein JWP01_4028 [Myxococcales bacterium]|nr:hypothetical protein [Myxococcales bacterium]
MGVMRSALVLTAVCTTQVSAGERTSSGPLDIRVPDPIVLGRDVTIDVRANATEGIRLVSSVGTIAAPSPDGDRTVRAVFTLPTRRQPQIAVVAGIDASGAIRDWLTIPLAGLARVKVNTDPAASVVVRLGTLEFGPVIADPRGVANVDVVVAPGALEARAIATTTSGVTEQLISLGSKQSPALLISCGGGQVFVVATTATGAPLPTPPILSVSAGTLATSAALAPGFFVASYAGEHEAVEVTATIPDAPVASCSMKIPRELPDAVTLTASQRRAVPGARIPLRIELSYPSESPKVVVDDISLSSEVGTITAPVRTERGWDAVWILPPQTPPTDTAKVRVRIGLPENRVLLAETSLDVDRPHSRPATPTLHLGAHAGYLSNLGRFSTPAIAISATTAMPVLGPSWSVGLRLTGYTTTFDAPTMDESIATRISVAPLELRLAHVRAVGAIQIWGGLGVGAAFSAIRVMSPSIGVVRDSGASLAVSGFAGGGRTLGPGRVVLDIGYLHATKDGPVSGRIGGLLVTLGYSLAIE